MKKICLCCLEPFSPRDHRQRYCSDKRCQRKRKAQWQRKKMSHSNDYRQSQRDAQKLWHSKNPRYMQQYRTAHPEYVEHNREQQKKRRNQQVQHTIPSVNIDVRPVVKMDAAPMQLPFVSGTYELRPAATCDSVVKMDAVLVQISLLQPVT